MIMKRTFNYIVSVLAILVAITLATAGGLCSLAGFVLGALLYVSGLKYPTWWQTFYKTNLRILAYFDLL